MARQAGPKKGGPDSQSGSTPSRAEIPAEYEMPEFMAATPQPLHDELTEDGPEFTEDFIEFYSRNVDKLTLYLRRLGERNAEDSVQQAMQIMWSRWSSWRDLHTDSQNAYVFRIARNLASKMWHEDNRDQDEIDEGTFHTVDWIHTDSDPPKTETPESVLDRVVLDQAINDLPPRQKEVTFLAQAGFSSREIGLILDISESTVNVHASTARTNLRKKLNKEDFR